MAILYSLGLLERKSAQNQPFNALEFVHLATEASRLANADRRNIVGDPAYSNVNSRVSVLLSPGYLNGRAAFIGSTGTGTVPVGGHRPMHSPVHGDRSRRLRSAQSTGSPAR